MHQGMRGMLYFTTVRVAPERVAEWERLMKSLQEPAPGTPSDDWWAIMEPVFSLSGNGAAAHAGKPSRTV